jgi:mono/diheme cytochrome c family protein
MARALAGAALLGAAIAALRAADHPPPPWEKNHLLVGQALYRENCVVCHDIDKPHSKKFGPSFYQLFRQPKMPLSNMKPNRAYIKLRMGFGGALMPAFRAKLTAAEMDTLIDYIESK